MPTERSAEAGALVAAIRAADLAHDLFAPGAVILVAVSGGPDSVALLDSLHQYAPEKSLRLHVAHLDHGLREGSVGDAAFVEGLAHEFDTPITLDARDVLSLSAREGRGIEDAARVVRYSWLASVALHIGAEVVVTGHHADDQAETVLMNLVRGAGLDGLSAMRPRSEWPIEASIVASHETVASHEGGLRGAEKSVELPKLVRPLLSARRATIMAYLEARGLDFRDDPSNQDDAMLRNRLRRDVMPVLDELNPALADALVRGAASIADDVAALEAALDTVWPKLVAAGGAAGAASATRADRIRLSRAAFRALPLALQRRALRRALAHLDADTRAAGFEHIEALRRDAASDVPSPPPRDLPDTLRARFDDQALEIGPARTVIPPPRLTSDPVWLAMLGETSLPGGWRVTVEVVGASSAVQGRHRDPWTAHLDADRLSGPLTARGRTEGDRFQPSGMRGRSKSIQDFFTDLKVPAAERDGWPLIVSGGRIVWVPGHRVDERVTVGEGTKKVAVVRVWPPARLVD